MKEGFELMIIGMGVVFSFLTLLVVIMYATAAFFKRFEAYFATESAPEEIPADDDLAEIAAIVAAVQAHAAH